MTSVTSNNGYNTSPNRPTAHPAQLRAALADLSARAGAFGGQ